MTIKLDQKKFAKLGAGTAVALVCATTLLSSGVDTILQKSVDSLLSPSKNKIEITVMRPFQAFFQHAEKKIEPTFNPAQRFFSSFVSLNPETKNGPSIFERKNPKEIMTKVSIKQAGLQKAEAPAKTAKQKIAKRIGQESGHASNEVPHTVRIEKGDTLQKVSLAVYGSSNYWPQLYLYNRGILSNPNRLEVGQLINTPSIKHLNTFSRKDVHAARIMANTTKPKVLTTQNSKLNIQNKPRANTNSKSNRAKPALSTRSTETDEKQNILSSYYIDEETEVASGLPFDQKMELQAFLFNSKFAYNDKSSTQSAQKGAVAIDSQREPSRENKNAEKKEKRTIVTFIADDKPTDFPKDDIVLNTQQNEGKKTAEPLQNVLPLQPKGATTDDSAREKRSEKTIQSPQISHLSKKRPKLHILTDNNKLSDESLKKAHRAMLATPQASLTKDTQSTKAKRNPGLAAREQSGEEQLAMIAAGKIVTIQKDHVQGRITGIASDFVGHFEVGLYENVSRDKRPLGYPVVQAILPKGEYSFKIKIPGQKKVYLFARAIHTGTTAGATETTWHAYSDEPITRENLPRGPVEIMFNENNKNEVVASSVRHRANETGDQIIASTAVYNREEKEQPEKFERVHLSGSATAMFSDSVIPLERVKVRVRGTEFATTTAANGSFSLQLPRAEGSFLLEFTRRGFVTSVQSVQIQKNQSKIEKIDVELASRRAIKKIARRMGVIQNNNLSIYIGRVTTKDGRYGLPGASAHLSLESQGPFYFSERGFPESDLKNTSDDGRFIFFNVEAGVGLLETALLGETVIPMVVSTVQGNTLVAQDLKIINTEVRGRLFNPKSNNGFRQAPVKNAKVRAVGSTEWTTTDSEGSFTLPMLKMVWNSDIQLEISAEKFYNHRYTVQVVPEQTEAGNLYAFPKNYINGLADKVEISLNPNNGIVIGSAGRGKKLRFDALADHSAYNYARDYYFDKNDIILNNHAYTDENFGTYAILNIPSGRTILQGLDADGVLRQSKILYISPSTVNVITP